MSGWTSGTEGTGEGIEPREMESCPVGEREGGSRQGRPCLPGSDSLSVACISGPSTWTVGWAVMVLLVLVEYMRHLAPFSSKETWAQGEVMRPGHSMSVMARL